MKPIALFTHLRAFLGSMRKTGTTTLLKKIAEENDVWVLVANSEQAKEFGDKAMTISDLKLGVERKPILFDPYSVEYLSGVAQDEIMDLLEKIRRRDDLISDVDARISAYKVRESLLSK